MDRVLFYPNMMKVAERLPKHYKIRYLENFRAVKDHSRHIVYEKGNWKKIDGTNKMYEPGLIFRLF